MPHELTRRSVLMAGAGLALAACGKKTTNVIDAGTPTTAEGAKDDMNVVVASFQPLVGSQQRLAFAVLDSDQKPIKGASAIEVAFSRATEPDYSKRIKATLHAEGIEERPYFAASPDLDEAGAWTLRAFVDGRHADAAFEVFDPKSLTVPVPGAVMISTPTPTAADPRGVEPICTRKPACPFHDVSLDAALAEKRPLVALFATPALCQSSTCGPVLDILMAEAPTFADQVRFVHVEIFTDSTGKKLAPAVSAYHLENEPFLFLAGADGRVKDRIDGAFDRAEARAYLTKLVG